MKTVVTIGIVALLVILCIIGRILIREDLRKNKCPRCSCADYCDIGCTVDIREPARNQVPDACPRHEKMLRRCQVWAIRWH